MVALALLAVLGVVLLVTQSWRRPPVGLVLAPHRPNVRARIDRRSLEHSLTRAALAVDGITHAAVRSRRRKLKLRAETDRRLLGDLRARVTQEVDAVVERLELETRPTVQVSLTSRRPTERSAMRRDPDDLNRLVVSILALALIAVAVSGLGRAGGWFGPDDSDESLLLPSVSSFVERHDNWFWAAATAGAILLAALALGWLFVQLRLPRSPNGDFVSSGPEGATRTSGDGLAEALEADVLASVDEVRHASARVTGDAEDADVDLRLELDDNADVPLVRQRIETEVLPRFERAASLERTTTLLDLRLQPAVRRIH